MDSGTFSGFMEQLLKEPAILMYFCLFGITLVTAVIGIVYMRNYRARKAAEAAAVADTASPDPMTGAGYDEISKGGPSIMNMDADLPDLDMLAAMPTAPQAAARPARAGTYNVKLTNGETVQAAEVMVILRDIEDGRLIVQLGDKSYVNLNDHPEAKQKFLKLMKELAQVVSSKPGDPAPAKAESIDLPPPVPAPSTPDSRVSTNDLRAELSTDADDNDVPLSSLVNTPKPSPKTYAPPPPVDPSGAMPGDLPKYKMDDLPLAPRRGIGLFGQKKEDKDRLKQPIPELNIASAIEAYLQHKLRYTAEFDGRSIHILPAPGGGVKIEVDGQYFEAVADVTDEPVRAFIATAIQEWQERQ